MDDAGNEAGRGLRPPGRRVSRRRMLATAASVAGIGGIAALIASCSKEDEPSSAPAVVTSKDELNWDMATSWPAGFALFGQTAQRIADNVARMSGGRFKIKVWAGGEKAPPLGVFDAVSNGEVPMGHSASYYWSKFIPAAQFFASVPFGMNAQQINAWLISGGGLALWRELYEPHNLVPLPAGNPGVKMGGWFRNPIKNVRGLRGLKVRIAGLGGQAMSKLGASQILLPASDVVEALRRGVLDATDWVGPYNDMNFGLHEVAKYYYYPGWHEPGTSLELIVDKRKWDPLSDELKAMVEMASGEAALWMLSEAEAQNATFLNDLVERKGVLLRRFPDDMLRAVKKEAQTMLESVVQGDPAAEKIYKAYRTFKSTHNKYKEVTEWAYQYAENV